VRTAPLLSFPLSGIGPARREEVALADNPTNGIERFPEYRRERFLTSDELAWLCDALRKGETIGLSDAIDVAGPNAKHAAPRRTVLDLYAGVAIRLLIVSFLGSKPSSSDEERLEPFFGHRLTP
jgi:hypothetical protein